MIELWWNEAADLLDIIDQDGLVWRQTDEFSDNWYSFEIDNDEAKHCEVAGWYRIGEL